jgi:hypothetical protein
MPLHCIYNQCPSGLGRGTSQLVATDTLTQLELQQLTTQVMVKGLSTLILRMRISPRKGWNWSPQCYIHYSPMNALGLPGVICTTLQEMNQRSP